MTNDRFKFRVFVTENEAYPDEVGYIDTEHFYIHPEGDIGFFNADYDYADYFVEQCTGLKDKNEKLIYEGDILKTLDGSICWVVWDGTSFWLKSPGSQAKDWEYNSFYEHCEVIGNIHQNQELLKESK